MRALRLIPIAALGLALVSVEAQAQAWPTKPIKAIVPFAAGSVTDVVPTSRLPTS
jgi:tripartite-type tricarboxylate transporter receptor subunit TctC